MRTAFTSFRTRLILTIFPVVAGIAIGVLMLAEWRFSRTYQKLFEEQFESQIATAAQARERRFNALSSVLDTLARQPALLEAMRRGDFAGAAASLRPALEKLGQERLQSELSALGRLVPDLPRRENRARPPREPWRPPNGGQAQPFIALVDAEGNFQADSRPRTTPPTGGAGSTAAMSPRSARLAWLGALQIQGGLKKQEVGYLVVEGGERRGPQVREVFVTPLRDPGDGRFLGAFVFGLPLSAVADRLLYEQSRRSDSGEIMSGLYVEGQLVSTTLPEDQKAVLERTVAASLAQSEQERREILLPIHGVKHRLFYRVLNPDSPFPQAVQVNCYSLAALDAEIAGLRRSAVGLGLVALLVALALVLVIARGLSGPIRTLVNATRDVERGNYEVRVPVSSGEIGLLAQAFNRMTAGLALQEKYRSVLNAVADRAVAERLIENREALGGELRDVTMLFCDIRGFTALTENMPPHEVIELLNEHMTALTGVAYDHGGIVDKFVGDLIMVLFGAPLSTGKDALRAVECARAMLKARRELNATCRHPLEVGIGIATGGVVAGCMGSERRLSYTVLGQRVNLASRLCGIAPAGQIVVDAATAAAVEGAATLSPMPPMQLKGFSEPVQVFRLL